MNPSNNDNNNIVNTTNNTVNNNLNQNDINSNGVVETNNIPIAEKRKGSGVTVLFFIFLIGLAGLGIWQFTSDDFVFLNEDTTKKVTDMDVYKLSLDYNDGTGKIVDNIEVMNTKTYVNKIPVKVERLGYIFLGWYTEKEEGTLIKEDTIVALLDDQILYARWEESAIYKITLDCNGADECTNETIEMTNKTPYGDILTNDISRVGYRFNGWYTDKLKGEKVTKTTIINLKGDQTLYARWEDKFASLPSHDVVFHCINGVVCHEYKMTIKNGMKFEKLPVPKRAGYIFVGWFTKDKGGNLITEDTIADAISTVYLFARWELMSDFKVTFNANGGTVEVESKTVARGKIYGELPVPKRNGYEFTGWYTDWAKGNLVTSSTIADLSNDQILYAHWKSL